MHNTNRVRSICSLLLSVLIFFSALPTTVVAEQPSATYVAYGDSISSGYGLASAASEGFTSLVAVQNGYNLQNEAVAGYTSDNVYAQISGGAHDHAISQAAVITLTCGGNDLMAVLYDRIAAAYNAEHDPDISPGDVITILDGRHPSLTAVDLFADTLLSLRDIASTPEFAARLERYSENLFAIVRYIRSVNPKAALIVCTQYNPYEVFRFSFFYGLLYSEVENGVVALNNVIQANAADHHYSVADVYAAFKSKAPTNLCNANSDVILQPELDFHPNVAGHAVIAEAVLAAIASIQEDEYEHRFGEWERLDVFAHQKTCPCGEKIVEIHQYDDGIVTTQPTHIAYGTRTQTCQVCAGTLDAAIPKLEPHEFPNAWQAFDIEQHMRSCSCGAREFADHSWLQGAVTRDPERPFVEILTYHCESCDAQYTEEQPHVHAFETLSDEQSHWSVCVCGEQTERQPHKGGIADCVTPARCEICETSYGAKDSDHHVAPSELRGFYEPKEYETGYSGDWHCTACDALLEAGIVIPETHEHDYVDYTSAGATQHEIRCRCGDVRMEPHSGGTASCVTSAICASCGDLYGEVDCNAHTDARILQNERQAGEWEAGYTGDRCCADCGAVLEHGSPIPPTHQHNYNLYQNQDEQNHKAICECGEEILQEHRFNEEGTICIVCQFQTQQPQEENEKQEDPGQAEDPTPPLPTPEKPDWSAFWTIVIIAACAAATMAVWIILIRKKTNKGETR